jgi:hypothetical protein
VPESTELVELSSGIDALYLSGRGELSSDFLTRLDELREVADDWGAAVHCDVGPLIFALRPHGWGKYRYCLEHPTGRVGFTSSDRLPPIRVQPRSEFLHAVGPKKAVETFQRLLELVCRDLSFGVSRLDLYSDVGGWSLCAEDRTRFVCRADSKRTYENGDHCTGFDFGTRRGATVCARVYDKTTDVTTKGSDWWFEIWGDAFEPGSDVTRVEIEFGRKALTEFGLDSPTQVLEATSGLWHYGTADWLTYRTPNDDSNRARWPIAPPWHVVQSASLGHPVVDMQRLQDRGRAGSLRKLTPGLVGYLVGFATLVGTTDVHDTVKALARHVHDDQIVRRTAFSERVRRRLAEGKIA